MNRIVVTVSGFAGTGKSTIAAVIKLALEKHGINTIYTNASEDLVLPDKVLTAIRLESLKDSGLQIIVEEKQKRRINHKHEIDLPDLPK